MPKFQMAVLLGVPVILLTAVIAHAAGQAGQEEGKFAGEYAIHGGSPGDITPPTVKDAKLSMTIDGRLAARMYRELGPKSQQKECVPDNMEIRDLGDISCEREAGGQTTCYIGFNLRSGKSIHVRDC
jgi:hypothetical protein